MKYKSKPTTIEAAQFFTAGPKVPGVQWGAMGDDPDTMTPFVLTAQGQRVIIHDGEWIVKEPAPHTDRYYPVDPAIFENKYEPVEPPATEAQS